MEVTVADLLPARAASAFTSEGQRDERPRGATGKTRAASAPAVAHHEIDEQLLKGALTIKDLAGQIHVVIPPSGSSSRFRTSLIGTSRIDSVSLGAGNPDASTT